MVEAESLDANSRLRVEESRLHIADVLRFILLFQFSKWKRLYSKALYFCKGLFVPAPPQANFLDNFRVM